MKQIKQFIDRNPYLFLIILAFVLRLVATFFSKGYGMHDDHFCVIEPSQSWVDGTDYNYWLPGNQTDPVPQGHSFFYVGVHYIILSLFKFIGISDPQVKMFLVRFLHAILSVCTVAYAYKIASKITTHRIALLSGIFMATFWFMTWLSVRNLVEVVATPFLMIGLWQIYKSEDSKQKLLHFLIAGLIAGIAFSIRFQTAVFIGGMGLVMLIEKRWKEAFVFGFGVIISIAVLQGVPDYFVWKRPFAELTEYIKYNIEHRYEYGYNNYFMYLELILGLLIPPVSLFFFFGFFRNWKKHLMIFLPTFLFILFHTYFPNKQERFVFTVLPMVVLLGVIGWEEFAEKKTLYLKRWVRGSFIFFWIVNIILLAISTTSYVKRSRVEAMYYLYPQRDSITSVLVDDSNSDCAVMLPIFYIGKWVPEYRIEKNINMTEEQKTLGKEIGPYFRKIYSYEYFLNKPASERPQFIIFNDTVNFATRFADAKKVFPDIRFETKIEAGNIDRLVQYANPTNRCQMFYIYKTGL